jgi:phosphopantothenoylcysteine decarboxylase/phosphopantothenate--cysteine ligase
VKPAEVLLGVTGSVAAYRSCEVVRLLVRAGHDVQVVTTPDAERFVGADLLAALSRRPVVRDGVALDGSYPHLDASREASVFCVAPCTANTLAKLALGLADSVLTQSALAAAGPLCVAPAMNLRMWHHPATQAHVETLRARGVVLIGPDGGELAEGESGMGRMSAPDEIAGAILRLLEPAAGPFGGRRVLVTAGGTREPLDGVRFLGNRSSGRMGAALADEAASRGAEVVTVLGSSLVRPARGTVVDVETTAELEHEARAQAQRADVVLMAAAVADYRPAEPLTGKRPRRDRWSLDLVPTQDVLAGIGADRRPGQVLVGFAAEMGEDAVERARQKLERKHLDLVVCNDVSRADIGFDSTQNEVSLVFPDRVEHVAKAGKREVAARILDAVEALLAARSEHAAAATIRLADPGL